MLPIKLFKEDGFYEVNYAELGISFLEFTVHELEVDHDTESLEGVDGAFIRESRLQPRLITARVLYQQPSYDYFHANKSKVYALFNPLSYLHIIDEREPHKKWKVKTQSISTITNKESRKADEVEITFISESPYATAVDETITTINDTTAYVMNAGDVYLDARVDDIDITFNGVSDKLRIVNETTNTQWQYLKTTTVDDEIYIDSIYPYKNDKNIFGDDTNFGVLEFAKGSNKIRVYGASGDFTLKITHNDLFI